MIAGSVAKGLPLRAFRMTTSGALAGSALSYQAHVNGAWQPPVGNNSYAGSLSAGTVIRYLRIRFEPPTNASICYQVHIANVGWTAAGCDDAVVGDGINQIEALRVYVVGYSTYGF
jgi:uncharacterized protein YjdB